MALLWCDGFEGYGDTNGGTPLPTGVLVDKYRWTNNESRMDMYNATTRWGSGWVLRINDNTVYHCGFDTANLTTNDTMIAGVSLRINNKDGLASYTRWPILAFKNEDGNHNVHLISVKGTFEVLGPNDTWLGSTRVNLERFTYHYVEMKVYHHATNGTVNVRVNGCPVLDLSSVNTLYAASKPSARFGIGGGYGPGANQYLRIDDAYVCDGSGNTCNDFLGPVRVETIWPDGDDSVSWTTTANSANHYDNVDRNQRDGSTDYVEEGSANVLDLFTTANTAVTWTDIHSVTTWTGAWYATSSAGLQQVIDSNGTKDYSGNISLATGVLIYGPHAQDVDPDTGNSWNGTTVNAMKTGFRTQP
jgi:hypothetical protein